MLCLLALGVRAPSWRARVDGRGWSWGFRAEGEENGSQNSWERKGWQNKDLKLKCDVKRKEEMSSLRPGDMGRGWAGGCDWPPLPRIFLRVEEAQDGLRNGLWDQRCRIEVPGKTKEQLHPVVQGISPSLAEVLGQKPMKDLSMGGNVLPSSSN